MTSANARAYAAVEGEPVDVDGTVVPVRTFGSGPPVLLVHGFPLSGFTWRHVLPALAESMTCYIVDLPGLGDSRWTDATDFSFPGQGATLHRVVDALGLDRYAVLAQDTGGTFARFLALNDPRVARLALINTEIPGHRPPWIPFHQTLMKVLGATAALGRLLTIRTFVRSGMGFGGCFADPALLDGEFAEEFIAPIINSPRRREGIRRYLLGAQWGPVDELRHLHRQLTMPVRLVWGTEDPTFPLGRAREMLDQIPNADLVEVPGARLLPHEERPDAVVAAVADFLAE